MIARMNGLTRRQVLAMGGGAAALAAGSSLGVRPAGAAEPITIFTWETYHEAPWIAEWTGRTGVPVNVVRTGSVDEMFAQTRSGAVQADILYFDTGSTQRYLDAGLIAPMDASQVPNASNVTDGLDYERRSSVDDTLYGIPYNWGTQPLMYNAEEVDGTPESWGILWDKKYQGRVNLFDDAYITFPMIALYVGAEDPYNLTDAEFEECRKALRALRPQIRTIARGFNDAEAIYAAGDAVIGYCQNISIVFNLQELGRPFEYTFPKEGTPTWIDNAVLTERGQRAAVYQFINDNLTKDWQARFVRESLNNGILSEKGAREAGLSEEILNKTNIADQSEPNFWSRMSVFEPPENIDRRLQIWNDFKAGVL